MSTKDALNKLCISAGSQAQEALALLSRILGNIVENPSELKFRRLNAGSAKLQGGLLKHDGASDFLALAGFVKASDGSFELPAETGDAGIQKFQQEVLRRLESLKQPASQPAPIQTISSGYKAVVQGGAQGAGLRELTELVQTPAGIEALNMVEKIILNVRRYPDTEKYRCINLAKPAGQKALPAKALLCIAGFEPGKLPTGEDCLQLGRANVDVLERVWAMVWWATRPAVPLALTPATSVKANALAAVLGAAIGDALGSALGGRGPHEVTVYEVDKAMEMCGGGLWGVAPGQVSGNTELSLCLAQSLAEARKPVRSLPLEDLALRYGTWGKSMPFRGERACTQAFQRKVAASDMIERAKDVNKKAFGAGALVRCMPLAALAGASGNPTAVAGMAREDAQLSHPDASVGNASVAYIIVLGHLVASGGDTSLAFRELQKWTTMEREAANAGKQLKLDDGRSSHPADKRSSAEEVWVPPGERIVALEVIEGYLRKAFSDQELPFSDDSSASLLNAEVGSVEIPFVHALRHLKLGSAFEVAMRAVLAGGGDSSTTASVVGGMIGAAVGLDGIPERWIRAVLTSDHSMGQTRPLEYNPNCYPKLIDTIC